MNRGLLNFEMVSLIILFYFFNLLSPKDEESVRKLLANIKIHSFISSWLPFDILPF